MTDRLEREPEIAAVLERATRRPPFDEVDWTRLHARIARDATATLARLRETPTWWNIAASWARPAIPLALAAGIALVLLVASRQDSQPVATDWREVDPRSAMLGALTADRPDTDVMRVMFGASRDAWVMQEVFVVR
ncbi:MAG TPA: hypothetical protein VFG84_02015 [Gemmatimonadaceae bacterium]|nr:hypothetical protein [Gemmatimonadaceae bacterium]